MTAPRTTPQIQDVSTTEYGIALLSALRLKAERQFDLISTGEHAEVAALFRLMLDILAVEHRIEQERYRLAR